MALAINGRGYAGVEEFSSAHALGCLWSLEDEHVASLDRYEGVKGNFYSRKPSKSKNRRMDRKYPPSFTSRSTWNTEFHSRYQGVVVSGTREIGLPADYLTMLESWADGPPRDA